MMLSTVKRTRLPSWRRPTFKLNINLGLACAVLVLIPALLAAELITRGYERRITEDVQARFRAYGWHVQGIDGHDRILKPGGNRGGSEMPDEHDAVNERSQNERHVSTLRHLREVRPGVAGADAAYVRGLGDAG